MNYNPYAPPQAGPPLPLPQAQGAGAPQPWEVGEVIGAAFEAFKANWVVLVFAHLLGAILAAVPSFIPMILVVAGAIDMGSGEYWGIYSAAMIVALTLDAFLYVGLWRISLAAARGERPEFALLFSGGSRFLAMLGTFWLLTLTVALGYVLLVVPGIILGLGLYMSMLFVVDQNMGPVDAMKASWNATQGYKGRLFLFGLLAFGMVIAGYIACFVGVFAVIPILSVASAIIYLRLSGRGAPSPAYGMPFPGPPGVGYPGQPYAPGFGPQGGYGGPQGGGGYGGPPGGGYGGPPGGGAPPGGYNPPGGFNPGGGGYGPPGGGGPPPRA
jgi:uncharacterized membrane protein